MRQRKYKLKVTHERHDSEGSFDVFSGATSLMQRAQTLCTVKI